jgi:hypothetical protein
MSNPHFSLSAVVSLALSALSLPALAETQVINLSGWTAMGGWGFASNTTQSIDLPANATVTGFSFNDLVFSTLGSGSSQLSDLVLSVNSDPSPSAFMDWKPVADPFLFGVSPTLSGAWNGSSGMPGPYDRPELNIVSGAFGTLQATPLFVTTYLSWPGSGIAINAGTLSISYEVPAVPEPRSFVLMGLGLLGIAAAARRRRDD